MKHIFIIILISSHLNKYGINIKCNNNSITTHSSHCVIYNNNTMECNKIGQHDSIARRKDAGRPKKCNEQRAA